MLRATLLKGLGIYTLSKHVQPLSQITMAITNDASKSMSGFSIVYSSPFRTSIKKRSSIETVRETLLTRFQNFRSSRALIAALPLPESRQRSPRAWPVAGRIARPGGPQPAHSPRSPKEHRERS